MHTFSFHCPESINVRQNFSFCEILVCSVEKDFKVVFLSKALCFIMLEK